MRSRLLRSLFAVSALLAVPAASPLAAPPVACELGALDSAERAQHARLLAKLFAHADVRTHAGLTEIRLPGDRTTFDELASLLAMERRCCPFLVFDCHVEGVDRPLRVRVSGPGAREFVADARAAARERTTP